LLVGADSVDADGEEVAESGRLDHADDALGRAPQLESPSLRGETLLGLDEQAQPARVDEPHLGHVDDDPIAVLLHEVAERAPKRRGRPELELAAERHDRRARVVPHLDRDRRAVRTHPNSVPADLTEADGRLGRR
jgi:hypothetical protein